MKPTAILHRQGHMDSNLVVHKIISAPDVNKDGDQLLLQKSSHFHHLRVYVASKCMHRNINRLLFFICDLFLMLLDLLLYIFKGFNQYEVALFATIIAAPRLQFVRVGVLLGKKDLNITDLEMYTMALEEVIDAKLKVLENHMEEKMQSLFAEFNIGRLLSRRKSQHGETSYQKDDPQECGHITSDLNNPRMNVDFPRWEEGDPIGWISCIERYFRFYRTVDTTWVEIATIHLKGDAIQ
ncbi:hypothetical protein B296_00007409 [Ensete ventricosum]|uniref:Uncharacterized protein n=1 Tax=Ensete ventricosum TaxID=4639 RepID=A0A427AI93_ENSVE|nr:hypothetical protein B296_00007409 [Ensete ventricosum]